jgi:hypothetical protein
MSNDQDIKRKGGEAAEEERSHLPGLLDWPTPAEKLTMALTHECDAHLIPEGDSKHPLWRCSVCNQTHGVSERISFKNTRRDFITWMAEMDARHAAQRENNRLGRTFG